MRKFNLTEEAFGQNILKSMFFSWIPYIMNEKTWSKATIWLTY